MSLLKREVASELSLDPSQGPSIVELPLLILVGVTGVGKSTALAALRETGYPFFLLPDRRTLTDQLIIAAIQAEDGETPGLVTDRTKRFEYTRRYRERYPGGMAHALAQLRVDLDRQHTLLCFDGLRGAGEVRHAARLLPRARFVVLHAPDTLRVERLLSRGDAFDRIETSTGSKPSDAALIDLPGVDEVFSQEDQRYLCALVGRAQVDPEELRAKVAIVVAERQNYDPAAAIGELTRLAPERTLVVDTAVCTPTEVAQHILAFWNRSNG